MTSSPFQVQNVNDTDSAMMTDDTTSVEFDAIQSFVGHDQQIVFPRTNNGMMNMADNNMLMHLHQNNKHGMSNNNTTNAKRVLRKTNIRKLPNILITGTPGVGKSTFIESFIEDTKHLFAHPQQQSNNGHQNNNNNNNMDDNSDLNLNLNLNLSLSSSLSLSVIDVNGILKSDTNKFCESKDTQRDCFVINESILCDAIMDEIEGNHQYGGCLIDTHLCGMFGGDGGADDSGDSEEHRSDQQQRQLGVFDLVIILRCDNSVLYDRLADRGYHNAKIEENVQSEIFQVIVDEANEIFHRDIIFELPNNTIEQQEHNLKFVLQKMYEWCANANTNTRANTNANANAQQK